MKDKLTDFLAFMGAFLEICYILAAYLLYIASSSGLTEYTVKEISEQKEIAITVFIVSMICIVFFLTNFSRAKDSFIAKVTYWISVFFGLILTILYVVMTIVVIIPLVLIMVLVVLCPSLKEIIEELFP